MIIRIPEGRTVNKRMSIIFIVFTVASIIAAIITSDDRALSETFCILAAIFSGFLLLFLIMWVIYYFVEKKKQEKLSTSLDNVNSMSTNSYEVDFVTFEIPYKELLSAARKRFYDYMKWVSIIGTCLAGIVLIFAVKNEELDSIGEIVFIFGLALWFPSLGFATQFPPYFLYKRNIPHKITFKTSLLTINEKQYYARNISELKVSSERRENQNSIKFYRTITVREDIKKDIYCVDFRDRGIRYDDYGKLVQYMKQWCQTNGVKLVIDYMD